MLKYKSSHMKQTEMFLIPIIPEKRNKNRITKHIKTKKCTQFDSPSSYLVDLNDLFCKATFGRVCVDQTISIRFCFSLT